MKGDDSKRRTRSYALLSFVQLVMLAALAFVLAWAYLAPGPQLAGLGLQVEDALLESGVESRVTAVLLNFRAYDTLLECFVLLLGVTAVWSFRPYLSTGPDASFSPILISLVRFLVPLMVLVAAYLLWAGSNQAGGAFQAGAILGAGGVLLLLSSSPLLQTVPRWLLPVGLCLGPFVFIALGICSMAHGGDFLEYRRHTAAQVIVALEAVAALSIGLSLVTLFGGQRLQEGPGCEEGDDRGTGDTR